MWYLMWGCINLCVCLYVIALLAIFAEREPRRNKHPCVKQMNQWLYGYLALGLLHTIRTVLILHAWHKKPDPSLSQLKIEVYYGAWVFLLETGWLIYGNTFIYEDEIRNCHRDPILFSGLTTEDEYYTVLALVIYGYILFAAMFFTILFYIALYFGYKEYIKYDLETIERLNKA